MIIMENIHSLFFLLWTMWCFGFPGGPVQVVAKVALTGSRAAEGEGRTAHGQLRPSAAAAATAEDGREGEREETLSSPHRHLAGGAWNQAGKLTASDGTSGDYLGSSLAGLGANSFVAGAYGDDDKGSASGSAYIFTSSSSGSWMEADKVVPTDGVSLDWFGYYSISSISESYFVVGCPAISGSYTGSAFLFTNSSGSWVQSAQVTSTDIAADDYFGRAVAVLRNGAFAAAADYDDDQGSNSGSAYIFTSSSTATWVQADKILPTDGATGDQFGYWALSRVTNTSFVVGAIGVGDSYTGAAYVFTSTAGTWVQDGKVTASDIASDDHFGISVADLSSSSFIVGSWGDDDMGSGSGSAYVFTRTSGSWLQSDKVLASDGATSDIFGFALAGLSSSTFIVGAYGDDDLGSASGSAYVFTSNNGGSWLQFEMILASDGAASDYFGWSLAKLDETSFIVGATQDDDQGSASGSVYVFEQSSLSFAPTLAPSLQPTETPTLSPTMVPTPAFISPPYAEDFCADKGYWQDMTGSWTVGSCNYSSSVYDSNGLASSWVGYYESIDLTEWTDYSVEWVMEIDTSCTGNIGLFIRAQTDATSLNSGQQYFFAQGWSSTSTATMIGKMNDGWTSLSSTSSGFSGRVVGNITARAAVIGSSLTFTVTLANGESQSVEATDSSYTYGTIGFRSYSCPTTIKYVNVTSEITMAPTLSPTLAPTLMPTLAPTSAAPTLSPTLPPTLPPTHSPTMVPTPDFLSPPFADDFCVDKGYWQDTAGSWSMENCSYSRTTTGSDGFAGTWIGYYDYIDLADWTDYSVEWVMEIDTTCTGNTGILIRAQTAATSQDAGQQYYFGQAWTSTSTSTMVGKMNNGWTQFAATSSSGFSERVDGNITAKASVIGSSLTFTVTLANGESQTVQATDSSYEYGTIAFRDYYCPTTIKYVNVTSELTLSPTLSPTLAPTLSPTLVPTLTPTSNPTLAPTPDPWFQTGKLEPSDGSTDDNFGYQLDFLMSESLVVVASIKDDDLGVNSGSAYIFTSSAESWVQAGKVVASDGASSDLFGNAIAGINNCSFAVSARLDDDQGTNSGSAYVFTRDSTSSWVQVEKLLASDGTSTDYFGWQISTLSKSAMVFTALNDDTSGSAYIFSHSSGSWLQFCKMVPSDGASSDYFGWSVAKTSQSSFVVGALLEDTLGTDSGSVYVFASNGSNSNWVQTDKVGASDGAADDRFGTTVGGMSQGCFVVGSSRDDDQGTDSGSAYVFTSSAGSWMQSVKIVAGDGGSNDYFGYAMAGIGNGSFATGAPDAANTGSVYIFTRNDPGSWIQNYKMAASDGSTDDYFGFWGLASSTERSILVGAYGNGAGSAYVFTKYTEPTLTPTLAPTSASTLAPTFAPTMQPTLPPTLAQTVAPSLVPTMAPTITPTLQPTNEPSVAHVLNSSADTASTPPSLVGAIFSSSGATITVEFSKATDLGASVGLNKASFDCAALLNFTGEGESCTWSSSSQVTITLGTASTVIPGDSVALQPGVLKSSCTAGSEDLCANMTYAMGQTIVISRPISPVVPIIVARYANQIARCADATIDVSASLNSGGRSFHYYWHLRNASVPDFASLASRVAGTNESILSLPNALLNPGATYNLTVYLQNFLGGNASKAVSFYVSQDTIPSLTLSGPSSIYVYDNLEVIAEAETTSCSSNITGGSTLTYTWEVVEDNNLVSTSSNPRLFKLGAYSLGSDAAYTIRSTVKDNLGFENTASFSVLVEQGELNAVILGGDQTIGAATALLLDGRQSSDLNNPAGNTSGAVFNWRVYGEINFALASFSYSGSMIGFSSADILAGSYGFHLLLEKEGRVSNNASVAVTVLNESVPETKITYVSTGKVNGDSKLVIPSTVTALTTGRRRTLQDIPENEFIGRRQQSETSAAVASWSLDSGSYPIFTSSESLDSVALTELTKVVQEGEAATFNLVVASGELVEGCTYRFRLEASYGYTLTSQASSSALLTVEVNAPPTSGSTEASPSTGVVLQDTFDLTTYDWADDPDDLPLFYRFFYGDGAQECGSSPVLLQAKSSANTATGLYLPRGNLTAGAEALDRHGAAGYACAATVLRVGAFPASVPGSELEAVVVGAAAAALERNDPIGALNLAGIGAAVYNASEGGAAGFQSRLLGVLENGTNLLDASDDSISRLAGSLLGVIYLTASLEKETLTGVLNLTDTMLGWGAELGILQDAAAFDLTDVLGDALSNLKPGGGDAEMLSDHVNELADLLAADLVEGEKASELVSQDQSLSIKVGKFSVADLATQTITPATSSSKLNVTSTSQILLNASAALTVMLSEFSSDIHTPAQTTNGSSAQLSDMLRLGVSGAANALSSFKVTIRFRSPATFNPAEIDSGTLKCITGMETLSYSCDGRMHSYNCNGQVGMFNFTCASAAVTPSCNIHNGTGWGSKSCEVLNYTTGAVTCLCSSEGLFTSSAARLRRLTVCDADNNCEDAEAFEADLVANTQAIGSEIVGNFALTDDVLTDFSLVQQNYIVFVTMGSIMVGIPFLAFVAHFLNSQKGSKAVCCRRRKAFKGDPKWRRKLRRLSILDEIGKLAAQVRHSASILRLFSNRNCTADEDVDPAQEFFQKLQKKGWELLKDDILGGNEYLQLFQPADGYTRAVTVARVLVVLFTIMFWDCTICAVVFPPGYSDCYFIASEDECVNSDLICGWDPYSQGCAPYSLEDTPGTMLYVSALTLAITIPIMAFLEWFIVHTIEAEIPQQEEEGEETAVEEGDYLASEGWTFPTSPGEKSPAPCLGPEEIEKKTNLVATLSPTHQLGLDGNLSLSLSTGGVAQQYQQNKKKDGNWVFPDSVGGSSHGLLSSRSSKNSSRAFMRPASRKELLDHRKPWLDRELVNKLVEERLAARTTSRTYMCIRWLGLGKILHNAIRRDVVLTLNLQERIAQAHGYPEDQDALLFEAAWCDAMGDHMFALLHKYTVREHEDSGSGEMICCLKPILTQQAVFWRKVLGWVSLLIYCIVCGFYVCLFGVNYGEDYAVGWFKAFTVGFAEDMVILSPMMAVSTFIAGRALARRPSLKVLRSLANRPSHSRKSAVVLAATHHPDLTVSKVLLDPFFEPPLSWQKRYNLQVDTNDAKYCRLRRWLWGIFLFVAVAFLTLPPDVQGTLVQGSGVLALYYGASFCFANSSGGGRKGSVYSILVLAAISVLFLWGYVLMPRERLHALWNYMKTRLLPSFKKTKTQSRSPTIQNLISRNGKKDSSTAFSKQNQEQHQKSPEIFSSSWSCEEGEASSTAKKLGTT